MTHYRTHQTHAGNLWTLAGTAFEAGERMDVNDVLRATGLDWAVEKRQAFYRDNEGRMQPIKGQHAPVRSDTGAAFPATVGQVWTPYQNREMVEFALSLGAIDTALPVLPCRGGQLGVDGARAFLEVMIGRTLVVRRGEDRGNVQPFCRLENAHDGSGSIVLAERMETLTCSNGAVSTSMLSGFRVRHTMSASERMTQGAAYLHRFALQALEYETTARNLARRPMSRSAFTDFCAQLLTGEDDRTKALETIVRSEGKTKTNFERRYEELTQCFESGIVSRGEDALDALESVTEFVDHQRGRIANWRNTASRLQLDRAIDSQARGTGAHLKARALYLLTR